MKDSFKKTPGFHKSEKPINNTGTDKLHLKCDCISGSFVIGIRVPILFCFAVDKPPGHKTKKGPRFLFFKKLNKYVLSHITFYLEHDDHKPVEFNGETICFTCQLVRKSE